MATTLQCPACGHRHRLDAVGDRSVFPCAKCSRQLKMPGQLVSGSSTRPGAGSSGSRPAGARPTATGAGKPGPGRSRQGAGQMRLPVRILAWVVAFVLGAVVVRVFAKLTGFVDSNTFVDLMLDHSISTYLRLVVIIPVWALFATLFATAFIEGPGWWDRRTSSAPAAAPRTKVPPAAAPRTKVPAAATGATTRRVPPRSPASSQPRASRTEARSAVSPAPGAAATVPRSSPDADSRDPAVAPDQRPRRIPRRDTGS